jgi:hypothetical protein
MTPSDRVMFESIAGDLLQSLGYERSSKISARQRLSGRFALMARKTRVRLGQVKRWARRSVRRARDRVRRLLGPDGRREVTDSSVYSKGRSDERQERVPRMTEATFTQAGEQVRPLRVFPFFVGCGRSGTTMVRAIFSSHPELAIPPESHFLARMVRHQDRYRTDNGFPEERFLGDLYAGPWLSRWGISREDIRRAVFATPPDGLADAVRRLFAMYARLSGKPLYGDKTPRYVLDLPQLARLFPEARFIHIIRDGRDVTLSLMEKDWGANNAVEGAVIWSRSVRAGREAARELGPARYREISYEGLIDDPETVVRSVCEFIELPFDPDMLRYYERPRPPMPGQGGGGRKKDGRLRLPPTKGLRDWRSQMPERDVAAFEMVAGPLLQDLGYEGGGGRLPAWKRFGVGIRVLWRRTRFAVRRMIHQARLKTGLEQEAQAKWSGTEVR